MVTGIVGNCKFRSQISPLSGGDLHLAEDILMTGGDGFAFDFCVGVVAEDKGKALLFF